MIFMRAKQDEPWDPQQIARALFDDLSYTAAVRDIAAHEDCMSRQLIISGIPSVGAIDYKGWLSRRRNELKKPLLYSLTYKDLKISYATEKEIRGSVREIFKGMNSAVMVLEKDFTMMRESDRWRIRAELIVSARWRE